MPAPATSRGRRNRRALQRDRAPDLLKSYLRRLRHRWAVRRRTFEEAGSQFRCFIFLKENSFVLAKVSDGYMIEIEQRQRTANMGLSELAEYLHLPMAEAARRLRLCSTALKHVCRRIGMSRWPSRQVLYTNYIYFSLD